VHNGARWNPATWPANASGFGAGETPCGSLGHGVHITNGKIANFHAVLPSAWNGSRQTAKGGRSAFEAALTGLTIADPTRPVEVLRAIHAFDPSLACLVHIADPTRAPT
jgi:hydrogenase large subunit